jgi:hypothetical protein
MIRSTALKDSERHAGLCVGQQLWKSDEGRGRGPTEDTRTHRLPRGPALAVAIIPLQYRDWPQGALS